MKHSFIQDQAIFDPSILPWTRLLQNNWTLIREEALNIRAEDIPSLGEISPDHGRIAADRRWKSFFLEGYGYKREENRQRAPMTSSLIDQIPDVCTASFSVIEPGGHIPRHRGMTKGMLNCHLSLKTPQDRDNCWIQLEEGSHLHKLPWKEGDILLFDDTYNHEVWNNTNEERYILFVQVMRPCRPPASWLLKTFFFGVRHSRFVQDIRRNLDKRNA
ncbi:aspartyl/asparaginyl beta-hydroxylase domain-containing protein [Saccharibacter sp. 17.LH.SD]|uniref:aspartyl/asparaginyl beta-hydroxylase domain-containing protein n=1 Tax=Saccharibacter sp. 17.LH.SD TaxID=2689393 RepID=UPI001F1D1AC5|nr:aspartyl/asparaginyl beta-hydroxylase domain-containing protein [Saccharibacter sp. 17.LH.SD]